MTENIYTAINKVMQEVGYVYKSGKVRQGGNYSYAGEADLISAVRPELVKQGIIMSVKEIKSVERSTYITSSGTSMNNTLLVGVVEFIHAPSESSHLVEATGEGSDVGDKSANKAMTGMYKYAIRQTFCIETGDDPDKQASQEQERGNSQSNKSNGNGHKPVKQEKPSNHMSEKHAMSYETASQIKDSKGVLYTDKTNEELSNMSIGIGKALKKPDLTDEKRDAYQMKQDAISTILTVRNRSK